MKCIASNLVEHDEIMMTQEQSHRSCQPPERCSMHYGNRLEAQGIRIGLACKCQRWPNHWEAKWERQRCLEEGTW